MKISNEKYGGENRKEERVLVWGGRGSRGKRFKLGDGWMSERYKGRQPVFASFVNLQGVLLPGWDG
jgi:hypothetical protein